jgi:hypothetical protein
MLKPLYHMQSFDGDWTNFSNTESVSRKAGRYLYCGGHSHGSTQCLNPFTNRMSIDQAPRTTWSVNVRFRQYVRMPVTKNLPPLRADWSAFAGKTRISQYSWVTLNRQLPLHALCITLVWALNFKRHLSEARKTSQERSCI